MACEIIGNEAREELEILCATHGIGFLRLHLNNIHDSEILIPARNRDIDFDGANRIIVQNKDFEQFFKRASVYLESKYLNERDWELVF